MTWGSTLKHFNATLMQMHWKKKLIFIIIWPSYTKN